LVVSVVIGDELDEIVDLVPLTGEEEMPELL